MQRWRNEKSHFLQIVENLRNQCTNIHFVQWDLVRKTGVMDTIITMSGLCASQRIAKYCVENEVAFVAVRVQVAAFSKQDKFLRGLSLCDVVPTRPVRQSWEWSSCPER